MEGLLETRDLGCCAYARALRIQESLVARRRRAEIADTLLLLEHPPVYTLGRGAREANILTPRAELRRQGIRVVRASRGGDVTYHGPGQLVGYPIVDLRARRQSVVGFVTGLETVLMRVLSEFGVEGRRDARNRGVWVGGDKIAAIGIRVTRGITMHGFALNVRTDLAAYRGIVPCGLRDAGVTSLHRLCGGAAVADVKPRVVRHFLAVFGYAQSRAAAEG